MDRRKLLKQAAAAGTFALAGGIFLPSQARAAMPRTPAQNEGPYYPLERPKVTDSNLLRIGAGDPMAAGEPLGLSGRVLGVDGKPLAGATVEIWQSDHGGNYNHPYAPGRQELDHKFQGFGETRTDATGKYDFLTIVPVRYGFRTPHIHVKIKQAGQELLTTQIYLRGHPENKMDNLLKSLSAAERDRLMMDLKPGNLPGGLTGKRASYEFVV